MPSHEVVPCIWLDDQAEQAAAFYLKAFGDGRVLGTSHYPESRDNPSGRPRGSVLTVDLELQGRRFTLLNGGPIFKPNPSVSFFAHVATPAAADLLYGALAEGGVPLMPIGSYPWSERYGWIADRFGVSWPKDPTDLIAVPLPRDRECDPRDGWRSRRSWGLSRRSSSGRTWVTSGSRGG